ncbi:hypothetical protein FVE85_3192 [Porphyridium purpureum]|uniref:Choice-of-anchor D domain-containing protein n=1 Tax=Porphyridium purpureum TaxID=35688 RepID=A0A5J4YTW2_PORPP|nr:hypothetical protein FVE85_3192 [Porphyridium purpureum]|eukprot:POR5275..scf227_4
MRAGHSPKMWARVMLLGCVVALALRGAACADAIPALDLDVASQLNVVPGGPVTLSNTALRLTPYAQIQNIGICAVAPNSYNLNDYETQLAVQDTSLSKCLPFPSSLASFPGAYACDDELVMLVSFDRTPSTTPDPVSATQTAANVEFTVELDVTDNAPGGFIGFDGIMSARLNTGDPAFTASTSLGLFVDDSEPAFTTPSGEYKKRYSFLLMDVPEAVSVVVRLSLRMVCPAGSPVPTGDDVVTISNFIVSYADGTSDVPTVARPYAMYRMEDLLGAGVAFPVVQHLGVAAGGNCLDGAATVSVEAGSVVRHCAYVTNIGTRDLTSMVVEDFGFGEGAPGTLIPGFSSVLPAGAKESASYESQFDTAGLFDVPIQVRGMDGTRPVSDSDSLTVVVGPTRTAAPQSTPGPNSLILEMNLTSGECSDVLLDPKVLITFPGDAHTRCYRIRNVGSVPVTLQVVDGGPAFFVGQTIQPNAVLEGSTTHTLGGGASSGMEVIDFTVTETHGKSFTDSAALLINPASGEEPVYCYGYRPAGEPTGTCYYLRYINDSGNLYELCDSRGCNPALQCFGYEKLESYYSLLEMRSSSRMDENCDRVTGSGLFSMSVNL